jgi:tellurite resistance protein TerA
MSPSLQPGGNVTLTSYAGAVTVSHDLDPTLDINLTAFLLTELGKVQDDSGIVFYNNPQGFGGVATFMPPTSSTNTQHHHIHFDLSKLPPDITKIAITLTEDNQAGFVAAKNLQAEVRVDDTIITLTPNAFNTEQGIIVLELYIRNGEAKTKAVWQGFASGLAGLCQHYGVEVADTPAAKPVPPKVILTKPNQTYKVSLHKTSDAPKKILVSATWIDNGDQYDNDDLDLRVGILLPDGSMKIIQAPDKPGAFNALPYVFHTGDVRKASATVPGIENIEVNPEISKYLGGRVALVFSVYSAISNGAVAIASLQPKMRMEYGDQIIECALNPKNSSASSNVYTYVIGLIEIDQDQISLQASGATTEPGSEATPWLQWHWGKVKMSLDGPAVFKGIPPLAEGKKCYS